MTKFFLFLFLSLSLIGCSTSSKVEPPPEGKTKREYYKPKTHSPGNYVDDVIDKNQLAKVLRMERSKRELGFKTKKFNTCRVGSGFNPNGNCRTRYFSLIHFRIRCRATTWHCRKCG